MFLYNIYLRVSSVFTLNFARCCFASRRRGSGRRRLHAHKHTPLKFHLHICGVHFFFVIAITTTSSDLVYSGAFYVALIRHVDRLTHTPVCICKCKTWWGHFIFRPLSPNDNVKEEECKWNSNNIEQKT